MVNKEVNMEALTEEAFKLVLAAVDVEMLTSLALAREEQNDSDPNDDAYLASKELAQKVFDFYQSMPNAYLTDKWC